MLNTEKKPIDFKRAVITVNQIMTAIRQLYMFHPLLSSNLKAKEITTNKRWATLG